MSEVDNVGGKPRKNALQEPFHHFNIYYLLIIKVIISGIFDSSWDWSIYVASILHFL